MVHEAMRAALEARVQAIDAEAAMLDRRRDELGRQRATIQEQLKELKKADGTNMRPRVM